MCLNPYDAVAVCVSVCLPQAWVRLTPICFLPVMLYTSRSSGAWLRHGHVTLRMPAELWHYAHRHGALHCWHIAQQQAPHADAAAALPACGLNGYPAD